jgi:curved DNA-binding protein CbpA
LSLERLEITPFAVIVSELLQQRRTGVLTILRNPLRKDLYWSQGELVLITSDTREDALGAFLVRRGILTPDAAADLDKSQPIEAVLKFHEVGLLDLSSRQTLLREWMTALFIPLFSLDEGNAAFTDDTAIEPERRVFLQSTASPILEGIRSITNGLVLRRSLGDLKREIEPARESRFTIEGVALTETERKIASSLTQPQTIEAFLRQYATDSVTTAKVVIGMLTLGIFATVDVRAQQHAASVSADDMQRDLELLAAIGASDQRSLRAVALSRQISSIDHYQLINAPRAATRTQIIAAGEETKKRYDPNTYPPVVRDAVMTILFQIDEAVRVLSDPVRRAAYDKLLHNPSARGTKEGGMQQRVTQRSIATQNFTKARELSISGDYYGAIVLLKQAVQFAPDMAEAWFVLGTCQERNPNWRREAAESFQMALSLDPNHIDALISLGDLYKSEGLATRAQTCFEDVLKIQPENAIAAKRLKELKRR